MAESAITVSHSRLQEFIVAALVAMEMTRPIAEVTAGLMVRTDLRGVDSHGIGMLPRYHELWQAGYIRMDAEPTIVRDEVATGLLDGQKGLGHYVSTLAMKACIEKARTYGLGMVAVRNSGHYGAAANYSMMTLEHDLRHAPFVLDMATTTVAIGKLSVASRWNTPIPSGRALDDSGTPTTDPFVALKHRLVTPLGGTRDLGGLKGYGLGMMVDILSGVMSGAVYGDLFDRSDRQARRVQDVGHGFAAIDPARFRPLAEFKRDMDDMFDALKSSPKADGYTRIWIAGEPEAESEQKRRRDGIPLAPGLVAQCNEVARGLGIPAIA